jgi:hypothetical protein
MKDNIENINLSKDEELIYELIYSERDDFIINLDDYIEIKDIDIFSNRILSILSDASVEVNEQTFYLNQSKNIWNLKILR